MFSTNYMTENYINCKNHANFVYFTAITFHILVYTHISISSIYFVLTVSEHFKSNFCRIKCAEARLAHSQKCD